MKSNVLHVYLSFVLIIASLDTFSQCPHPNATIALGTQNAVDKWLSDYPNCTVLNRDVIIAFAGGPVGAGSSTVRPLTNLNGLKNIQEINGTLRIAGPPGYWQSQPYDIWSISGMSGLRKVHTLIIDDVPNLMNITFDSLETVNNLILKELPNFKGITNVIDKLNIVDTLILEDVKGFDLTQFDFPPSLKLLRIKEGEWTQTIFMQLDNVTEVEQLELWDTDIVNINSDINLSVLKKISLSSNKLLEDISGLNFPEEMEEIYLVFNPLLSGGLDNFEKVKRVGGLVQLIQVTDISAFGELKHIGSLSLVGNESVTDFSAFVSLESVGDIQGSQLPDQLDMSTFSNVEFFGVVIRFSNVGVHNLNDLQITNFDTIYSISFNSCENLSDLNFLSGVKKYRAFHLGSCPSMTNLNGLRDMTHVDLFFELDQLDNLSSLSDLSNLQYCHGLWIRKLNVSDLSGLEGLKIIKDDFYLADNPNLKNLNGLSGLEYLGIDEPFNNVKITDNPLLESLDGFNKLKGKVEGQLVITNNTSLSPCSIDYVCSNISHGEASISISNNGQDCNSEQEVIDKCGFNFLEVFLDDNGNGIQDAGEPNIDIGKIKVGNQFLFFPNIQGRVSFFIDDNPGFIEYVAEDFWEVTTDNAFTETNNLLEVPDLIKIGIKGKDNFLDVNSFLSFSQIVCNRNYNVKAIVKNEGTERINANMRFTALGEYLPSWPLPSDTTNNSFLFEFGEILPGQSAEGYIRLVAPSIVDVDLNSVLELDYVVDITDQQGIISQDAGSYEFVFLCAYDPNDKQVFPSGVQDENFTLFEEDEFEYLIRFQNTGNFPAQDVTVKDTLDENLDLSTFKLINASHELTRIRLEGSAIDFDFKNIFLPDSTNNEPESHGFIHFKVRTKEGLPENTRIENTAHIYFDFNPPIVTNTVFNTMVTMLPTSSVHEEGMTKDYSVYPNPVSNQVVLRQEHKLELLDYTITDLQGKILLSSTARSRETKIDVSDLTPGIYFIRINEEVQMFVVE